MNIGLIPVYLRRPYVPYRVATKRQVPLRHQDAALAEVQSLQESEVIVKEDGPTEWCSPAFFVPKKEGKVRLVTDYTKLNKFVIRPIHPFPSVQDIIQSIPPGMRFFAKLDALNGYFQLALDEESSKLTTFLLPYGRFRYLRSPMGLSSSSDEFCRYSDRAIEGLPWTRKIVDDILVWAPDMDTLADRLKVISERCKSLNIVLSKKKVMVGDEIPFAGLLIGAGGVKPDPERLSAIAKFPAPKDSTGVKSFLGLANQLSGFIPDYAHMSVNLRALTSSKGVFQWLDLHQKEFEDMKRLLTSPMVVTAFDPARKAILMTDASRLYGIGFALGHRIDGQFKLVACGSKSLTPAPAYQGEAVRVHNEPRLGAWEEASDCGCAVTCPPVSP